jgi:hypothetical protein
MKQSVLSENEEISSQHEDIDSKLFYFLMRRLKVSERELGSNLGDYEPLKIKEYKFEGFPGYGFTDYVPKKRMETKIIEMLSENDITDYIYDMDEQNPKRVKIVKTVRKFLNFMLSDQK